MFDFLKGKKPMTNFEYNIINNANQSGFFPENENDLEDLNNVTTQDDDSTDDEG